MTTFREARTVLRERRNWLTARIRAKESIGWDVEWDRRERDALTRVLEETSTSEEASE